MGAQKRKLVKEMNESLKEKDEHPKEEIAQKQRVF